MTILYASEGHKSQLLVDEVKDFLTIRPFHNGWDVLGTTEFPTFGHV